MIWKTLCFNFCNFFQAPNTEFQKVLQINDYRVYVIDKLHNSSNLFFFLHPIQQPGQQD